jgi:hypothetical protein
MFIASQPLVEFRPQAPEALRLRELQRSRSFGSENQSQRKPTCLAISNN